MKRHEKFIASVSKKCTVLRRLVDRRLANNNDNERSVSVSIGIFRGNTP